ncbi:MAG TPA: DUF4157 domain-containing protein [Candidatus Limnocylindrales bacterium]|nr:DUF4157 domain-containing protein [Candidatus Limnocylindrales bacterium]
MRDHDHDLDPLGRRAPRHEPTGRSAAERGGAPVVSRSPALDVAAVLGLQRTAGNASVVQMLADDEERSPVHDVVGSGGGAPLDTATRSGMESAFGTSFDHVRVHTDDRASRSAEAVGAHAYTVGSDVVFRSGQYNPSSPTGQRTIAHELAHVVQQSSGPVDGADAGDGIRLSDPSDRFEQAAEDTADEVMSSVQRQAVEGLEEEEEEQP